MYQGAKYQAEENIPKHNWTLKVRLQEYQARAAGAVISIPKEITMATRANKMLYWVKHWKHFFVDK